MSILISSLFIFSNMMNAQRRAATPEEHKIDSLLRLVYTDEDPGAAVAVLQKNKLVYVNVFGMADLKTKTEIDLNTSFNIASLTKQFTAMAILQLAEKKKLSLDDKLIKFFPGFNKKIGNLITVRQLLSHSSGLIDHYDYTDTKNMKHAHNADALKAVMHLDSTYFPPGTQYRYSNTAYCLLALIIEKISGLSYAAYMKKNIFLPAGMTNTAIWEENKHINKKALGYNYNSDTKSFEVSDANENIFFSTEGDGGVYTIISDYVNWFNVLQTGKVFSKNIIEQARTGHVIVSEEKHLSYGYGWFIEENTTPTIIYHSGSNGGFRTFSFTVPEEDILILIFSNRNGIDLEKLATDIYRIINPASKPVARIEPFVF